MKQLAAVGQFGWNDAGWKGISSVKRMKPNARSDFILPFTSIKN
jgi:hypothetical protein